MADDITLKMNVDITDANSAIAQFNSATQKAFKSSNTATQSMGNSLNKVTSNIQSLVVKMRDLENTKVPTQQYTALQSTIASLTKQTNEAKQELDKIGKTRVETRQYAAASEDVAKYRKQLEDARIELGRLENQGIQRTDQRWINANNEVQKYFNSLVRAENTQQQLINSNQQFVQNSAYDKQAKKVQIYEQSLQSAKNRLTQLQMSGNAFTSGANTSEYQKLTTQLTYAVNQASLLNQKINQSNGSASTLVNTFKQFGSSVGRAVSTVASKMSSLGHTSHNMSLLHNKSWKSMLTTILKYGFGIRSVFLLYRKVRAVIKTGLTEMAKQFEDVRADVDGLKNSWSGFKASIVSAFQPIFSYVVPALTTLINYLTTAMNALANFFALLTGQSYYYKAKKGNESVANAIGGTGSAAEEATEELADYDDLLVIDQDKNSGGGGGGGGSSDSDAWNWEKVDVTASAWYEKLKKAFSNWDFTEIGTEIGNKLVDAMKKIPWDTIYSYASNFGKGLATFLNGLISTDLFSELGSTIAKALNTAFLFLNTFGKTFNWTRFGESIGEGITSFFKDADFSMWGDTVHTWVSGILDAGIKLLETTDFELIGEKLGDFLESVQVDDLLSKVKTLCSNIITAIGKTLTGFKSNTSEKTKLITALGSILGVLAITKSIPLTVTFAVAIGGFKIGEMLYESATGNEVKQSFIDELEDIWDGMFGEDKIEWNIADAITFVWKDLGGQNNSELNFWQRLLYGTLSSMFAPAMVTAQYGKIIIDLKDLVELKWSSLSGKDQKTLSAWSPVQYFLKPALDSMFSVASLKKTIHNVIDLANLIEIKWDMSKTKEKLKEMGENIPKGIKDGIKTYLATNPFVALATTLWDKVVDPIKSIFGINSPATKMYPFGENIFKGIITGFKTALQSFSFIGLISQLYSYFTSSLGKDGMNVSITSTLKGALKTLADYTGLSDTLNTIKTKYKNIKNKVETTLTGTLKSIADYTGLGEAYKEIKNSWEDKKATFEAWVGGQISKISDLTGADGWKSKIETFKKSWDGTTTATFAAKVGGQIASIDDLANKWNGKIDDFRNNHWVDKTASFGASFFDFNSQQAKNATASKNNFATNSWKNVTSNFGVSFTDFGSSAVTSAKNSIQSLYEYWSWYDGTKANFTLSFDGTSNANAIKQSLYNIITDINSIFSKNNIKGEVKRSNVAFAARGGIVSTATSFIAGEAGKEAIIPLERNLGWLDKMATMISTKVLDMQTPSIANGQALPSNPDFYATNKDNNVTELLQQLVGLLSTNTNPTVLVELEGRQIAEVVWDETEKRYRQTGRRFV